MELKNRKGFVHTLEAVIAASLLITTASVVIPQLQPDTSIEDTTQENIFQGIQTLDKTGELRSDLSTDALKDEIEVLNPNEFNMTVLVADTETETFRLEVEDMPWRYVDRVKISALKDWEGEFDQTSVDRSNNSGNLGIGYLNGTASGQSFSSGLNDANLKAYWRMDRTGGAVVDYSGQSNEAKNYGATRGVNGTFSTSAFNFTGDSDTASSKVNLSSSSELDYNAPITVTLWVNPDDLSGLRNQQLVDKEPGGAGGTENGFSFFINNELDRLDLVFGDGNTENSVRSSDDVVTDSWQFLAFKITESDAEIFRDGSSVATTSNSITGLNNSDVLSIGEHNCDSCQFTLNGAIDEVRYYNRALSDTEIRQIYFSGQEGAFEGNYSNNHNLNNKEVPEKIQVDSSNINSGNVSWVKVETSEGESNEFKLDSGTSDRNYSLGFSQPASEVDIEFNFSVDNSTPINTPVINDLKLWTNDTSDRSIEFDKSGDSVKSQIFVDDSEGLNISYNSNLIAENITESKYVFQQTDKEGLLKFYGDANLTVDITNKTIKGDPAIQDNVKNVNYPIYQNGSKEVTVSTWN